MSEFAHLVDFGQPPGRNREGALTACWLPQEAALVGIEVQFEHLIALGGAQIVVISRRVSTIQKLFRKHMHAHFVKIVG